MQLRLFFALPLFAAMVLSTPATYAYAQILPKGTSTAQLPKSQEVRNFSAPILDKVVPGHTTKVEVEALLGKPWRVTNFANDPADPSVDIWEFRGRDSNGT